MDTHAAVRMQTAADADETLAVAVVDVAQNTAADHGREFIEERNEERMAPDGADLG